MNFIGVTYKNVDEDLQEQKWLKGKNITKVLHILGDISQKPETYSILHSL